MSFNLSMVTILEKETYLLIIHPTHHLHAPISKEKLAREVYSTLVLWVDIVMLCPLFLQLD